MIRPSFRWPAFRANQGGPQTPAESGEQSGAIEVSRRALLGGVLGAAAMPAAALAAPAPVSAAYYIANVMAEAISRSAGLSYADLAVDFAAPAYSSARESLRVIWDVEDARRANWLREIRR